MRLLAAGDARRRCGQPTIDASEVEPGDMRLAMHPSHACRRPLASAIQSKVPIDANQAVLESLRITVPDAGPFIPVPPPDILEDLVNDVEAKLPY